MVSTQCQYVSTESARQHFSLRLYTISVDRGGSFLGCTKILRHRVVEAQTIVSYVALLAPRDCKSDPSTVLHLFIHFDGWIVITCLKSVTIKLININEKNLKAGYNAAATIQRDKSAVGRLNEGNDMLSRFSSS